MAADILGLVKNLTSGFLNIKTVADGAEDYTDAQVNVRLQLVLGDEVLPKFQQAGWVCPANYPTTEFSTRADENQMVNAQIAKLVAYSLVSSLVRIRNLGLPPDDEILLWRETAVAFFNRIATNNIKFQGITRTDVRNLKAGPKVTQTAKLFGRDYDDGDGHTYDATEKGA